jgi:hypothetical protein
VGLTRCSAGAARRHTCRRADVGIAGRRRPSSAATTVRAGTELGCPRARGFRAAASRRLRRACAGRGLGRVPGARAVLGCATGAAGPTGPAHATRGCSAVSACRPSARSRPSAGGPAVVGRRPRGGTRARVGSAQRFTAIPDPDGSFVEPAGPRLECTCTFGIHARGAGFHRLGRAATRVGCATPDRRTRVERARIGVLGRTEDRGTRGTASAIMVGAGSGARRARACLAAVERARIRCTGRHLAVVATGTRRTCTQLN